MISEIINRMINVSSKWCEDEWHEFMCIHYLHKWSVYGSVNSPWITFSFEHIYDYHIKNHQSNRRFPVKNKIYLQFLSNFGWLWAFYYRLKVPKGETEVIQWYIFRASHEYWFIFSNFHLVYSIRYTTKYTVFYSIFSYKTNNLEKVSKMVWIFESSFIKIHFINVSFWNIFFKFGSVYWTTERYFFTAVRSQRIQIVLQACH